MIEEKILRIFNFKFHLCNEHLLSFKRGKTNGSENYVAHRIQGKSGEKLMVCHCELPTTTPSYILNINIHILCVCSEYKI